MSQLRYLAFVLLLLGRAGQDPAVAGAGAPSLKLVSDRSLQPPRGKAADRPEKELLRNPSANGDNFTRLADIRWDDDGHILLAACNDGTFRLPVSDIGLPHLERAYAPLPDMGFLGAHMLLGTSREFLVAAAPAHVMSWISRTAPEPKPVSIEMSFNILTDLDVSGDRLLVLGLQKLEKGKLSPDGAIAWTAKLGRKLTQIRPVHFSVSGPGAHDADACSEMQMGKVRFLAGGAFVVVPGAEPGIFVHDSAGRLVRTWQAETVGFDAGCPITEQEMYKYSADVRARYRWLNQRRILDEVLPLPTGIGFVVRTRFNGLTRWQLKVLAPDGKVTAYDIPATSPSEYARLAGDVRGNRIAFLLELDTFETPPAGSQHLIIAEVPPPAGASPTPKKNPSRP